MLKAFKDFLLRGNVVDLAVAVVIGAAFTAVVNTFADSFLTPLIGLVTGGGKVGGRFTVDGQEFTYGAFISQVITFVLTAAVLYFFVVLPMKALGSALKAAMAKEKARQEEASGRALKSRLGRAVSRPSERVGDARTCSPASP